MSWIAGGELRWFASRATTLIRWTSWRRCLSSRPGSQASTNVRRTFPRGIYWINTSRPLAQRILDSLGAESTRWRDYMFQRYVEIILKESLYTLEKTEGDLSADRLQGHIDSLYTTVYDQAFDELESFLFSDKLKR